MISLGCFHERHLQPIDAFLGSKCTLNAFVARAPLQTLLRELEVLPRLPEEAAVLVLSGREGKGKEENGRGWRGGHGRRARGTVLHDSDLHNIVKALNSLNSLIVNISLKQS